MHIGSYLNMGEDYTDKALNNQYRYLKIQEPQLKPNKLEMVGISDSISSKRAYEDVSVTENTSIRYPLKQNGRLPSLDKLNYSHGGHHFMDMPDASSTSIRRRRFELRENIGDFNRKNSKDPFIYQMKVNMENDQSLATGSQSQSQIQHKLNMLIKSHDYPNP